MTQQYEIQIFNFDVLPTKHIQLKYSADGTNYEIKAYLLPNGIACGYMCNSEPVILIISGYNKTAYTFANQYQSVDYIHEKLCPRDSHTDARNLKVLVDKAMEILFK